MGVKPVLVNVDEERWKTVRARSQALGISPSQFVDNAIASVIGDNTEPVLDITTKRLADAVREMAVATVANYVSTSTSGSGTIGTSTLQRSRLLGSPTLKRKK